MKKAALFIGIVIVCLVILCSCSPNINSKADMRGWVNKHQALWSNAIATLPTSAMSIPETFSPAWSEIYQLQGVNMVWYYEEEAYLSVYFSGSFEAEKSKYLMYDLNQTTFADFCTRLSWLETEPVRLSDTSWRWDNLGIDGTGYVVLHTLIPNWYYVESYIPT